MLKNIGFKRLASITVLLILAGILYVFYYHSLKPDLAESQQELKKVRTSISETRNNLAEIKNALESYENKKDDFQALVDQVDFFNPQDRVDARQKLNAMKEASGLNSAVYSILPAEIITDERAKEASYNLIITRIELQLEALEENDIFRFLYLLNYGFPGFITVEEILIAREADVTQPVLRQIGASGKPLPTLVSARIVASWRTMTPDRSAPVTGGQE